MSCRIMSMQDVISSTYFDTFNLSYNSFETTKPVAHDEASSTKMHSLDNVSCCVKPSGI